MEDSEDCRMRDLRLGGSMNIPVFKMMRPDRRQVLEVYLPKFTESLECEGVIEYLKECGLINDAAKNKILREPTVSDQRRELVTAVKRRGDEAYDEFFHALRHTGQTELSSILEPLVNLDRTSRRSRVPEPIMIQAPVSQHVYYTSPTNRPHHHAGMMAMSPSPPNNRYSRTNSPGRYMQRAAMMTSPRSSFHAAAESATSPTRYSAQRHQVTSPTYPNLANFATMGASPLVGSGYRTRSKSRMRALRQSDAGNANYFSYQFSNEMSAGGQAGHTDYIFTEDSMCWTDGGHVEKVFDRKKMYENFSNPRGLCLIINNENFQSMPMRMGSKRDKENISTLFGCFGYTVLYRDDLAAAEMKAVLRSFAQDPRHRSASSAIVVILSHGEHETIIGVDDQTITTHELYDQLSATKAPLLANKPKLWFVQACRGDRRDMGFPVVDMMDGAPPRRAYEAGDGFPFFNCIRPPVQQPSRAKPDQADMLIAYATVPQYVSWRNSHRGSWFIQSICEVFGENAKDKDVVEMLTEVNYKVAMCYSSNQDGTSFKQMPELTSRLLKKFYFWPSRRDRSSAV